MDIVIKSDTFKSTIYGGWFIEDKLLIEQIGWGKSIDIEMSQIDELIKMLYDVKLAYSNKK